MSFQKHRKEAPKRLKIGVVVVSDSRYESMKKGRDTDVSGKIIVDLLQRRGHQTERVVVPDSKKKILRALKRMIKKKHVIIFTGGTGITRRDITIEAIEPQLEKTLPGFGEVLRRIGYEKVGAPALLTRATAGVFQGRLIFCLPGAPNAVKIAMRIIAPELPHLVKHARE